MDDKTQQILQLIQAHIKIKNYLTKISYFLIIGGLLFYFFHAFHKSNNAINLINNYQDKSKSYNTKKIMTNPNIKFQYNENEIYDIKAQKALHENEKEVILYNISAIGNIGEITAGELKIGDNGEHLIFTENPILILNQQHTKNE